MIGYSLKIGQRIFDAREMRWGKVLLISGKDEDKELTPEESNAVILYKPDNSSGECEIFAEDCYPLVEGRYFWGKEVCLEINKNTFDADHDYDFYCPERNENCWEFEVA